MIDSREETVKNDQDLEQDIQLVRDSLKKKNEYSSRSLFLKQQINELGNEDTLQSLEQMFATKLALARSYQRKLTTVHDPYARKVLQRMLQEERTQLMSLADLIDMVQKGPDMSPYARTRARMSHQFRSNTGRNLAIGAGLALLGMMLYPTMKEKVRPMVAKAMEGVIGIADQAQNVMASMKEDLEDIVSEAQFERLKNFGDSGFTDADFELGPEFEPPQQ